MTLKTSLIILFLAISINSFTLIDEEFDPVRVSGKWFYWAGTYGKHFNNASVYMDIYDDLLNFAYYGSGSDDDDKKYWFMSDLLHQDGRPLNEYKRFNYINNLNLPETDTFVIVETDYLNTMIKKVTTPDDPQGKWNIYGRKPTTTDEKYEVILDRAVELSGLDRSEFIRYD